jgi:hypothetical protein
LYFRFSPAFQRHFLKAHVEIRSYRRNAWEVAFKKQAHDKLVRIYPSEVQFDPKDKLNRKVISEKRWETDKFGRFFNSPISIMQIYDVVAKTKVKLQNLVLSEKGDLIVYQYKGRPMISLNRTDGQFYAAASDIELVGKSAVEHQAHIILEILKTHGLSAAVIGKSVHSPSARNLLGNLKTYK